MIHTVPFSRLFILLNAGLGHTRLLRNKLFLRPNVNG